MSPYDWRVPGFELREQEAQRARSYGIGSDVLLVGFLTDEEIREPVRQNVRRQQLRARFDIVCANEVIVE